MAHAAAAQAMARALHDRCLYADAGWWSYELCWQLHLRQFHVPAGGSIRRVESARALGKDIIALHTSRSTQVHRSFLNCKLIGRILNLHSTLEFCKRSRGCACYIWCPTFLSFEAGPQSLCWDFRHGTADGSGQHVESVCALDASASIQHAQAGSIC